MSDRAPQEQPELARSHAVANALLDRKGENLIALDVRELVSFADVFIIVTGRSDRQVRSLADSVNETLAARGERALGVEGQKEGRWLLMDLGDIIVHIFQAEVRETYDLERLWSDAARLDLGQPDAGGAAGDPDGNDSPHVLPSRKVRI